MKNPQMYAVNIELIMRRVFSCERFGIGGIVNSDQIRQNPYFSMVATLTYVYAIADAERKASIAEFITGFSYFSQWNIDEILAFESESRTIDGCEYGIGYPNGEEAIKSMIDSFANICH